MSAAKTASQVVRRIVPSAETRTAITLRGLPKTAIPADIRRLCVRGKVESIANVAIDYKRFSPTGSALVTLTGPQHLRSAVRSLNQSMVAAHRIAAFPSGARVEVPRMRGGKGRIEAAQRGIVAGDGPNGGISNNTKSVVLFGLPGKMTVEALTYFLKSYKLADSTPETKEIVKMDLPTGHQSLTARFLVRLASGAEAHRLVRKLHETFYEPDIFDKRYRVRARVIY